MSLVAMNSVQETLHPLPKLPVFIIIEAIALGSLVLSVVS